ncbi:DUF2283 domain-containing protein [Streptomyces microflavus]|jgi:uncharacterized protein YuzE|uniref:DUF2283 domain-containing protein n=1 Tax=Streptomyces microflavus TaxID=1919 RepID=A0A7J0CQI9_STRMI|nr:MULTISPECIES: DUF2283 domain-containing protein [Streptomyces]MCX4652410.1 DUF2283 domain-containing protein [Streptomyces microflavus]MDX2407639.1 DUF2283 domain-containing protein [Streptomyces microflavus]MDX2977100.1 DUF2283 domain-containing protein [Streptomyces sp. NRRL_B-2249]WSS36596.1 DUF2283 domain-containing protein [Streptomyces microflavus]WST14881.1 DUF2283 domain-containing protein [Streptomyces microflavus]
MHIEYDHDNDVAYVSLVAHIADGAAGRQFTLETPGGADLNLDFDEAGRLLGFEVIGARAGLPEEVLRQASRTDG